MTRIDSHVHVVADPARAPMVGTRTYTPPPAPLAALQQAAGPSGVGRFVVVQPSFYGTDNRVTLAALAELGPNGRGVAVIDPAIASGDEIAGLNRQGIRGLRLNLYSTLSQQQPQELDTGFAALSAIAARMGWHVEVLATVDALARNHALLAQSPATVVIDHYGLYAGHSPTGDPGQMLLDLLNRPHVWIKLSAPYRSEPDPLATRPDLDWMAALLEAGHDRCVWGSDWPHTPPHELQTGGAVPLPYRDLPYDDVVAGFIAAVGDREMAETILTANPARLYGFDRI